MWEKSPLFISYQAPSSNHILSLPNEILLEIARHLKRGAKDLTSLMQTCHRICRVVEYTRYNSIVVCGTKGKHLLSTLLSGSTSSTSYCNCVKRLWFRAPQSNSRDAESKDKREFFLIATLISQVLTVLPNLSSLWIEYQNKDCSLLSSRLKRTGAIRSNEHPASCLMAIDTAKFPVSPLSLPSLRFLRLTGDPSLISLSFHRALSDLEIHFHLNHSSFAEFITSAEGTVLGRSLKFLGIRLSRTLDIATALPLVSQAFPLLERVSLEQSTIDFVVSCRTFCSRVSSSRTFFGPTASP